MFIKILLFNRVYWFAGYDTDGTILKGAKSDRVAATDNDVSKVQRVCNDVKLGGFHICEVVYNEM